MYISKSMWQVFKQSAITLYQLLYVNKSTLQDIISRRSLLCKKIKSLNEVYCNDNKKEVWFALFILTLDFAII